MDDLGGRPTIFGNILDLLLEKTAPSHFGGSPLDTLVHGEDWLVDAGSHGHFLLPLGLLLLECVGKNE